MFTVAPCQAPTPLRRNLAWVVVVALTGCGNTYQAPVTERSEILDRSGPVIVQNSDDSPSRYGGGAVVTGSRAPASQAARPLFHNVTAGDSLYAIAYQYGLDVRQLAGANGLVAPSNLTTGQVLSLDVNQPRSADSLTQGESVVSLPGQIVGNSSIARAQPAAAATGGVMRQPIVSTPIQQPAAPVQNDPPTAAVTTAAAITTTTATVPDLPPLPAEPLWRWPVDGDIATNLRSGGSARQGIDIRSREGQVVYAAAAGDVVYSGNGIQGSGNLVIIRHNDRLLSAYAFNRTLLVREGQRVMAGEPIAEVGTDAEGTALLHFEIRQDGKPVDPVAYLPRL